MKKAIELAAAKKPNISSTRGTSHQLLALPEFEAIGGS
jgi:hypothetical protein